MGRAPSSGDSPSGSPTGLIDVQVGEVYENVRTVAENIDAVTNVSTNLADIVNADATLAAMQATQAATEQAAADADADRIAAANSAATATAQVPLAQNQVTLATNQVTLATNQANAAAASATTAQNWATNASASATAADNARIAAVAAQTAAQQAAQDAAGGAAFGTLGGAPEDNTLLAAALNGKVGTSLLGANNGVATLNSAGQLFTSQLPAISFIDTYERGSEAEMLGLIVQKGDVCVRSDINKSFIANGGDSTTLAGWTLLRTPTDAVLSVNGLTGAITLSKTDIGLGNVDNTSDVNKPVSSAMWTELNKKLQVGGDGGLEIGSYLDFHNPAADGVDYRVRFLADAAGTLNITASNGMYVNGVLMPDNNTLVNNYVPKNSNIGNADLNAAVTSGFHRYDVPTNGPGTGFNYAPLIVARANDTIAQIAFSYNTGDMAWRAGNPPQTGGGASWGAWDKISNYVKKSDPTFTGATMWLNTNKALWQHDGSNAYFRSQVGDLHLGAGGNTKLSINGTNGAITAIGPITVNVGAQNTGIDLASNDCYANLRVQRNTNGSMPGMWFGYGGAAGNLTFCPGGTATGMLLDTANKLTVYGDIVSNRNGSPTTGVIYLGNTGNTYLHYDGTNYNMPGANLILNGARVPKFTKSTAAPSGGADGDVHFQV